MMMKLYWMIEMVPSKNRLHSGGGYTKNVTKKIQRSKSKNNFHVFLVKFFSTDNEQK